MSEITSYVIHLETRGLTLRIPESNGRLFQLGSKFKISSLLAKSVVTLSIQCWVWMPMRGSIPPTWVKLYFWVFNIFATCHLEGLDPPCHYSDQFSSRVLNHAFPNHRRTAQQSLFCRHWKQMKSKNNTNPKSHSLRLRRIKRGKTEGAMCEVYLKWKRG